MPVFKEQPNFRLLTEEEGSFLVRLARRAVVARVTGTRPDGGPEVSGSSRFRERQGVFVTVEAPAGIFCVWVVTWRASSPSAPCRRVAEVAGPESCPTHSRSASRRATPCRAVSCSGHGSYRRRSKALESAPTLS